MTNFVKIRKAPQVLDIDSNTADEPTRRKFISDGEHLRANMALPDVVIKQTSEVAAYWRRFARSLGRRGSES